LPPFALFNVAANDITFWNAPPPAPPQLLPLAAADSEADSRNDVDGYTFGEDAVT